MDFSLSEEQQLLKDSVDRFVRDEYDLERRRRLMASADGFSRDHWRRMAELGWLGVALPEDYGGIGGGAVELMVLMESFGASLPKLAQGELLLAFAYAERQSRFDLHDVAFRAEKDGAGYVLNGHKGVVLYAAAADKLIVSARTAGGARDTRGITLFLVDREAPGLSRRDYPTVDGQRASELEFKDVRVGADTVIGEVDDALPLIEAVADRAAVALCAEAMGCMQVLHDMTNEYLKTRVQFGRPIGSFQVLQHRMVDIFMECEQSRSMTYMASLKIDAGDEIERRRAVSAAKVQIGRSGRFVGQQSVQLHGGMGMTEELAIGHYFKRLAMIDVMFGNADHHLKRYGSL